MPVPSTIITLPLSVPISTGQEAIWQIIRDLDKRGPWAVADIDSSTVKSVITTISEYVARLERGGFIEVVGTKPVPGRTLMKANLYRVKVKTSEAPRVRRDGTPAPPSAQQQMWRAMRSLQQFTYRDLARIATTDVLKIGEVTAKTYVQRLSDAGYLQLLQPAKNSGGLAIYRLNRKMNSGPLAPQILRTHFVFDPNRKVVVGDPSLADNAEAV